MTMNKNFKKLLTCRYEAGKWRHIQKDNELGPILKNRSNVDLKDKWRNLNMDSGGSRRDSRGGGDKARLSTDLALALNRIFADTDDWTWSIINDFCARLKTISSNTPSLMQLVYSLLICKNFKKMHEWGFMTASGWAETLCELIC